MVKLLEIAAMLNAIIKGYYPEFVFGNHINEKIPVFFYHDISSSIFKRHLEYLKINNYKTIDIIDLDMITHGSSQVFDNSVMLTFDDGYSDLYTIAFPLLAKYGFKAVAFVSPFWIGRPGYITWDQAREINNSGVIDIQSHSYSHYNIPVAAKVVDFYDPSISCWNQKEVPILDKCTGMPVVNPMPGTPIYKYVSGLSDQKRFISDGVLECRIQEFIKERGMTSFFNDKNWKKVLRKMIRKVQKNQYTGGKWESYASQKDRIRNEIFLAKQLLEAKLGDKAVRAFACPRHHMSGILLDQLCESGMKWIFGGILPFEMNRSDNVYCVNRINVDFLFRLPGKNRDNLFLPFLRKILPGI